ncbi:NERD domain-containing protein [Pseudomonas asiatica]|uniref:NERD domain-containing protein n=1 Tax=Pseudomonas asiatica TaxID=2219225 RepID=UPI003B9DED9F|nr:NERD domain-containing protein [Pseudomonas shirazica]
MLVLPSTPLPESTGSERKVLSLLGRVEWGDSSARALSSLNLSEHVYQRWGEIDFLLVGTRGLIAIEVKGGNVTCVRGKWKYEDRLGRVVTRGKSPLVQAKDAYFSLVKNYVDTRLGRGFALEVPAGFCVILAGMARKDLGAILGGPEFPMALVGTRDDLANPASLQRFLEGVADYWRLKNKSRRGLSADEISSLVGLFRPEFELVRPLRLARQEIEEQLLSLTEEQYSLLDLWDGAERVFCSSPAGCGKTLLAVEILRRAVSAEKKALLLVGSHALASALRLKTGLDCYIFSIGELERTEVSTRPLVEVLLIDEGQLMLSSEQLALMDSLVIGGIAHGKWAWFGDPSFQQATGSNHFSSALQVFQETASVRPRLTKNCRNTPEIILATELAAGVPLGHAVVKGRGLSPTMLGMSSREGIIAAAARQVRAWLEEDIPIHTITLLADESNPSELIKSLSANAGVFAAEWSSGNYVDGVLAVSSIESFRGLESGFVIICIFGAELSDDDLDRMLYLSMTRGNYALSIVADSMTLARVHVRMADNAGRNFKEAVCGH